MSAVRSALVRWLGREAPPAVRHDQVIRLLNLGMRERDAGERELDPDNPHSRTPDFDRAHAQYWAQVRLSTQAELVAADEAARRYDAVEWWSAMEQSCDDGRAR